MKTASFFTYTGPGRISIARFEPRGTPPGYRRYRALAPRQEMLRMPYGQYHRLYVHGILARLDPRQVLDDLHELAGDVEPVLLCWERPPLSATNWCHRRMVAEWLSGALGLDIPELIPQRRADDGAGGRTRPGPAGGSPAVVCSPAKTNETKCS